MRETLQLSKRLALPGIGSGLLIDRQFIVLFSAAGRAAEPTHGPTDTGWMTEEQLDSVAKATPLDRVGQPADAARLVTFLCSPAGGWINGQLIHSDGGFTA